MERRDVIAVETNRECGRKTFGRKIEDKLSSTFLPEIFLTLPDSMYWMFEPRIDTNKHELLSIPFVSMCVHSWFPAWKPRFNWRTHRKRYSQKFSCPGIVMCCDVLEADSRTKLQKPCFKHPFSEPSCQLSSLSF